MISVQKHLKAIRSQCLSVMASLTYQTLKRTSNNLLLKRFHRHIPRNVSLFTGSEDKSLPHIYKVLIFIGISLSETYFSQSIKNQESCPHFKCHNLYSHEIQFPNFFVSFLVVQPFLARLLIFHDTMGCHIPMKIPFRTR